MFNGNWLGMYLIFKLHDLPLFLTSSVLINEMLTLFDNFIILHKNLEK